MTVTPNDPTRIWLKMVPNNRISDDGVWTQSLLAAHHTKRRASQPDLGDAAVCSCGFRGRFADNATLEDSIWMNEQGNAECVECARL